MTFPSDKYKPMALGPLGRGWSSRARYAGTYDQQWLDDVFPFLPKDFDVRYYQAAPEDQQIPLPKGPMEVLLSGFTADGVRQFTLPHFEAPVHGRGANSGNLPRGAEDRFSAAAHRGGGIPQPVRARDSSFQHGGPDLAAAALAREYDRVRSWARREESSTTS